MREKWKDEEEGPGRRNASPSVAVSQKTPGLAQASRRLAGAFRHFRNFLKTKVLGAPSAPLPPSSLREASKGFPTRVSRQDLPGRSSRGKKEKQRKPSRAHEYQSMCKESIEM